MKKFQLKIDTESINKENETHQNNFHIKIKNLAEHCVRYLEGVDSQLDCTSRKLDKDYHDLEAAEDTNQYIIMPEQIEQDINKSLKKINLQNLWNS